MNEQILCHKNDDLMKGWSCRFDIGEKPLLFNILQNKKISFRSKGQVIETFYEISKVGNSVKEMTPYGLFFLVGLDRLAPRPTRLHNVSLIRTN